jgi:nicotinamidase-related amidase
MPDTRRNTNSGQDYAAGGITLARRMEETHAFSDPENLADLLFKYEDKVGLLVIDVQKVFCDPQEVMDFDGELLGGSAETEAASQRIGSLVPQFRKAGIPVYAVYYADEGEDIDCYKYTPKDQDKIILKNSASAFEGGNIKDVLEGDHRKLLLTCGFNFSACVHSTVDDARSAGFEVCVMDDITKDGLGYTQKERQQSRSCMTSHGVVFSTSQQILQTVQRQPRQTAAYAFA